MATPIIPWIGGKRRLARHILPLFGEHTCYVEPFCGAAALFFMKKPVKAEVLNDINGELVNLYRVVQHHLEEFIRQFKWSLSSRQIFKWMQATPIEPLTDIQRATRFYYLQKSAWRQSGRADFRHQRHSAAPAEPAAAGRGLVHGSPAAGPRHHRASGLG